MRNLVEKILKIKLIVTNVSIVKVGKKNIPLILISAGYVLIELLKMRLFAIITMLI